MGEYGVVFFFGVEGEGFDRWLRVWWSFRIFEDGGVEDL